MSTVRIVAIAPHYAIRSFVSMVVVLTFTGVTITDAFSVSAPFRYQTRHSWLSSPLVAATTTTTIHSRTRVFVTPTDNEEDPTSAVLPPLPSTTTTTTTPTNTNSLSDLSPTEFILATEQMDPTTRAVVEAARKKQLDGDNNNDAEERSYPIDLPSPVLLASSMIFAIISTGSLFQLFDNTPKEVASASTSSFHLGVIPTAIIVLIGAPFSIFLLYAAITKATAETEADDKAFLSGK